MAPGRVEEPARERDVPGDHAPMALRSAPAQRQPDLERPESPRVLQAEPVIVEGLLGAVRRRVVRRAVLEGGAQARGVADEGAPRLERDVHPLVRIHGDGVGEARCLRAPSGAPSTPAANPPYAASTWNQRSSRRQSAERRGRSSTAPVETVPALPTTRNGSRPAARSSATSRSSAATSIRWASSAGTHRIASVPRPKRSAALWIQVCVSSDA